MSEPVKTLHIEISDKAYEVVQTKALALGASERAVVEAMILEFSPSTSEERDNQGKRWQKARLDFCEAHPDATVWQAWRNGYVCGWKFFQIRKRNLYDLRNSPDTPIAPEDKPIARWQDMPG